MSFLNKIKDALFEEEEIDVSDEIVKQKNESPIAKRIVFPSKDKGKEDTKKQDVVDDVVSTVNDEDVMNAFSKEKNLTSDIDDFVDNVPKRRENFKILDDSDFKIEDTLELLSKNEEKEKNIEKEEEKIPVVTRESLMKYDEEVLDISSDNEEKVETDNLYSGKGTNYNGSSFKRMFKPSPIISPIYGIVDSDVKVETKSEVKHTYSYESKKMTIDEVRKKAYENRQSYDDEKDNTFVDLNESIDAPSVDKISVGDAQEYYDDLGLEYNVDYVDKTTKKRVEDEIDSKKIDEQVRDELDASKLNSVEFQKQVQKELEKQRRFEDVFEKNKDSDIDPVITSSEEVSDSDDDNLFDLIDSMYEKEK